MEKHSLSSKIPPSYGKTQHQYGLRAAMVRLYQCLSLSALPSFCFKKVPVDLLFCTELSI